MPDTSAATSTVTNQLPPRTHSSASHRWPRKWATLGGRGAPSITIPSIHLDDTSINGKGNGHHHQHHANGNGHARHSSSLFRKSSTISRSTAAGGNADLNHENSLKKSRSLINVLRSKLNSPAVLRRFRTKSRENAKPVITEITIEPDKLPLPSNDEPKKSRKRDPSPMRRLTHRLAQLTRSSTHTSIETEQQTQSSSSPPSHNQDQVDHINACYDEIRAKYFDTNNNSTTKSNTISILSQHPCAPPTERLKEMLSTTTSSSIDYHNLTNGDLPNRSLSTISMNGSLLSHDLFNTSSSSPPPPRTTTDDPLLVARKQSNIKLNCMLSGYGFTTPFGNQDKVLGQHDLFKFHHYHDVGKRKYDFNFTSGNNRMYSSMRTRPMSRSIDSFRRPVVSLETDIPPATTTSGKSENDLLVDDDELVIREEGDLVEAEPKSYASTIRIQPAVPVNVKTFVSCSSSSSTAPDGERPYSNGHISPEQDQEFERNFLRAVDRALGMTGKESNQHLLQPVYDVPKKCDETDMDLLQLTERALSSFNHSNYLMTDETKQEQFDDEHHRMDGAESPNVELFDRTGELLDNDMGQWQSSAVYDHRTIANGDDLTRKTQEVFVNEPKHHTHVLIYGDGLFFFES